MLSLLSLLLAALLDGDRRPLPSVGALTPFWAARLDRTELTGYQASRRGGYVRVALHGDRTHLSGQAVTTIDGDLLV